MTKSSNSDQASDALTVDEARDAILQMVATTTRSENIAVGDAIGRCCTDALHARLNVPSFRNSAMDGYAVRSIDCNSNKPFNVIGTSLAGKPNTTSLDAHQAIKVTTGAAVPDNADAIIIKENATETGANSLAFTFKGAVSADQHIRNIGDDITQGQLLIDKEQVLSAADTGLIAAQGIATISVFAKPRVAIFSTGDELVEPTTQPGEAQIYDSNRTTLRSMLLRAGIETDDLGICEDDPEQLKRFMQKGYEYDFLLSSGGVSVGEADFVKQVLSELGKVAFWKVAMKPGKPLVTGILNSGTLYFGLPGNPVSSMVTCTQFVEPAIKKFAGAPYKPPLTLTATLLTDLTKAPGRFEFQRGCASTDENGKLVVSGTGKQDSHVLRSMSLANCYICLERSASGETAGNKVSIILFDSYPTL